MKAPARYLSLDAYGRALSDVLQRESDRYQYQVERKQVQMPRRERIKHKGRQVAAQHQREYDRVPSVVIDPGEYRNCRRSEDDRVLQEKMGIGEHRCQGE